MKYEATGDDWLPGPIGPKPARATVPVSVRMPQDLYEQLRRRAKQLNTPRSYLIVECIRRLVASYRSQRRKPGPERRKAGRKSPQAGDRRRR